MIFEGKKYINKQFSRLKKEFKKKKELIRIDAIILTKNEFGFFDTDLISDYTQKLGIKILFHKFEENLSYNTLKATFSSLNMDLNCKGYFVQLPLSKEFENSDIMDFIDYKKDLDCQGSCALGKYMISPENNYSPIFVKAVIDILKSKRIKIESKVITIIDDYDFLSKPLGVYFLNNKADVTICSSKSPNLVFFTKNSDIIITSSFQENILTSENTGMNQILIDAGLSHNKNDYRGNIDLDFVRTKAFFVVPLKYGVNEIATLNLFDNLLQKITDENKK